MIRKLLDEPYWQDMESDLMEVLNGRKLDFRAVKEGVYVQDVSDILWYLFDQKRDDLFSPDINNTYVQCLMETLSLDILGTKNALINELLFYISGQQSFPRGNRELLLKSLKRELNKINDLSALFHLFQNLRLGKNYVNETKKLGFLLEGVVYD